MIPVTLSWKSGQKIPIQEIANTQVIALVWLGFLTTTANRIKYDSVFEFQDINAFEEAGCRENGKKVSFHSSMLPPIEPRKSGYIRPLELKNL